MAQHFKTNTSPKSFPLELVRNKWRLQSVLTLLYFVSIWPFTSQRLSTLQQTQWTALYNVIGQLSVIHKLYYYNPYSVPGKVLSAASNTYRHTRVNLKIFQPLHLARNQGQLKCFSNLFLFCVLKFVFIIVNNTNNTFWRKESEILSLSQIRKRTFLLILV